MGGGLEFYLSHDLTKRTAPLKLMMLKPKNINVPCSINLDLLPFD